MNVKDWQDLASVFRAGAERAFGWSHNAAMQQHAEILETQADRCDAIARERDGYPMVTHEHYTAHGDTFAAMREARGSVAALSECVETVRGDGFCRAQPLRVAPHS